MSVLLVTVGERLQVINSNADGNVDDPTYRSQQPIQPQDDMQSEVKLVNAKTLTKLFFSCSRSRKCSQMRPTGKKKTIKYPLVSQHM